MEVVVLGPDARSCQSITKNWLVMKNETREEKVTAGDSWEREGIPVA